MQTFLPYSNFDQSAKCLDIKRLGKQRVEAYQILKTLLAGPFTCTVDKTHFVEEIDYKSELGCRECGGQVRKTPWYNHPAVQMWKGYNDSLVRYIITMCNTWTNLGFNDTILEKALDLWRPVDDRPDVWWLGNKKFHTSHRSNLLRKDLKYYSQFNWLESNDLPYFWPTKEKY